MLSLFSITVYTYKFISILIESIKEDKFTNQTTGAHDINKDTTQRETFC